MPNPNNYTTDVLVANVALIGNFPFSNSTFSTSGVATLANRELQTPIMKQILSTRGGYYKTYVDLPIVDSGLYLIPANCIAGVLDNVQLVNGPTIIPVNLIEESEQFSTISPTSTSYGYFMVGNYVQILPTPNIGVARFWFMQRPSALVLSAACCNITAIAGAVITVASIPSTIQIGSVIDCVADQPPFQIPSQGLTILNIVGMNITLSGAADPTLNVFDWIALTGQTCVPQIPVEFRILLEQRTICQIYETQGYLQKLGKAKDKLKELEEMTLNLITPRVKSSSKIISSVNGGFLSGNANRRTNFQVGSNS